MTASIAVPRQSRVAQAASAFHRPLAFTLALLFSSTILAAQQQQTTPPANRPSSPPQSDTASRIEQLRADLQAGRIAKALQAASELSAQNKNDVQLHFTLGGLLLSEKQYKPARLELEKANALQPDKFEILVALGEACLRSADYNQAELLLDRALKLKPDSPTPCISWRKYIRRRKSRWMPWMCWCVPTSSRLTIPTLFSCSRASA